MSAEDPERIERELAALLGRVPPEGPSPQARARAREAFLAGAPGETARESQAAGSNRMRSVMSSAADRSFASHTGEGEPDGFAAWVGAHSRVSGPGSEARRRARLAFLSVVSGASPAAPPSRSYRALVLLAAAAAIVAVTLLVPAPDRWRVRMDGGLALDEEDYQLGEEDQLAARLEHSGWVETRANRAHFALGGVLLVELAPGSSLRFPPLPELDGLDPVDFELQRGEAYVRTVGAYPGNPIRILTDGAEVALSGTTVGVLVDALGTCVCVAEGRVRVRSARGSEDVPARQSLRLFRDSTTAARLEPFPGGNGPEARHVQDLLEFLQGR